MKQDGLTVINSTPLISLEKAKDKKLDQLTLPERADLLKEAYNHVDGAEDITDEEMELIARFETAFDSKVASWGLFVKKIQEAHDLCKVEQDYYTEKANAAKERSDKFKKKVEQMQDFLKRKMVECNKKKVETPLLTIALRKKPQKVEILEDANLEDPEHHEFVLTTVSKRWDKKAIKSILSEGQLFKSVKLSDEDFSISIK